jgi:ABC-type proline/glycine betaine transport system ATPase subunit
LALLTIETTQNSSEGLGLSKEDLNRINKAYYEQIFENKEECSSKEHMINTPIESYQEQFLQTNSELCNLERNNNLQDQTILTKNLDSRVVQEPIEEFINNFLINFENNNYTQDQQCMFKGHNTEKKISHNPDNEIIADELREIQEHFFQNFNEEMNQEHLVSENGIKQSITNDKLVCETIDENVRKIRELLDQIIDEELDQQHDISFNEMEEKAFNESLDMAEEIFGLRFT